MKFNSLDIWINYGIKINFTYLFLMWLLENFKLHLWLASYCYWTVQLQTHNHSTYSLSKMTISSN